jgi:hypothetical protein
MHIIRIYNIGSISFRFSFLSISDAFISIYDVIIDIVSGPFIAIYDSHIHIYIYLQLYIYNYICMYYILLYIHMWHCMVVYHLSRSLVRNPHGITPRKCYTPFQSCKAEDFSSLFNVALSNFESVDVYLVFPDTSCHFDAHKKKMWTWYQTLHDLWNPKCSFHQVWIHARAC